MDEKCADQTKRPVLILETGEDVIKQVLGWKNMHKTTKNNVFETYRYEKLACKFGKSSEAIGNDLAILRVFSDICH